MKQYVQLHRKGNPQLMIETFLPKRAKPMVRCLYLEGSKEGEVLCRKKGMWIDANRCYGCGNNRLTKK